MDRLIDRAFDTVASSAPGAPHALRLLIRHYMTGRAGLEAVLGQGLARAAVDCESGRCEENERVADWLFLFVEAAGVSGDERLRKAFLRLAGAARARWQSPEEPPSTIMRLVEGCLLGAELFPDPNDAGTLIADAIDEMERVVSRWYRPGSGFTRLDQSGTPSIRPEDQIDGASTLLSAYTLTGRLPYPMLAEELVQFARRLCWPAGPRSEDESPLDAASRFLAGCAAVPVLCRLTVLHADPGYQTAAVVAPDVEYRLECETLLQALIAEAEPLTDQEKAGALGLALSSWLSIE